MKVEAETGRLGLAYGNARQAWGVVLATMAATVAALLVLFAHDVATALSFWTNLPTYNYCFAVIPIAAYLVYRRRGTLALMTPRPSPWGIALAAVFACLWWLGSAALIIELRHIAIVGMILAVVLGILGLQLFRALLFPLLYLFLMVPTGTPLLPFLQTATVALSTRLIHLSGVPIFVEGARIEVPHGFYYVAPGCAGLNFLLASLVLSLLFASQMYSGMTKRLIAVAAAMVVSVLANAVRVFAIIWLAEYTGRKLSIVDDHLLYGWGFFTLVIFGMMAIGLRFADRDERPHPAAARVPPSSSPRWFAAMAAAVAIATLLLVGGIEAQASLMEGDDSASGRVSLDLPASLAGWSPATPDASWTPSFPAADATRRLAFARDGRKVDLFVAYYWGQRDGHKVTATENLLASENEWATVERGHESIAVGGVPLDVASFRLTDVAAGTHRRLWAFYWIGGRTTAEALWVRGLNITGRLRGDGRAAIVAIATTEEPDPAAAKAALAGFLDAEGGFAAPLRNARLSPR